MSRYVGVNLKRSYANKIDEAIADDPFIDSRTEFIRRAIEKKIKEMRGEKSER